MHVYITLHVQDLSVTKLLYKLGCSSTTFNVLVLPAWYKTLLNRGYVLDLLEGERKLIVFGHHRAVLDAICDSLQSKVSWSNVASSPGFPCFFLFFSILIRV